MARGVFVQPGLALSDGERQELRRNGLVERNSALDSDIFLVERFSGVDHDLLLSMFLVGGRLVTRSFLQRGRRHGPATLQFVPAPFVRRLWLSFSAQLRGARPRQVKMVEDAAMRRGSAWSVVSETQWPKWHSSPKRNECFAVYTSAEIKSMTNPHHGAISWSRARARPAVERKHALARHYPPRARAPRSRTSRAGISCLRQGKFQQTTIIDGCLLELSLMLAPSWFLFHTWPWP